MGKNISIVVLAVFIIYLLYLLGVKYNIPIIPLKEKVESTITPIAYGYPESSYDENIFPESFFQLTKSDIPLAG